MIMSKILVNNYRQQFTQAHNWLDGVIDGVTQEVANEQINPKAMKIAAQYVHIVYSLDTMVLGMFGNNKPLAETTWKNKTGFSPNPPQGGDQFEWSKSVTVSLENTKAYCQEVHQAIDTLLASLDDKYLNQEHDFTDWGMGMKTKAFILDLMLFNTLAHTGEIANMKGMKNLLGYPW